MVSFGTQGPSSAWVPTSGRTAHAFKSFLMMAPRSLASSFLSIAYPPGSFGNRPIASAVKTMSLNNLRISQKKISLYRDMFFNKRLPEHRKPIIM